MYCCKHDPGKSYHKPTSNFVGFLSNVLHRVFNMVLNNRMWLHLYIVNKYYTKNTKYITICVVKYNCNTIQKCVILI